MPEELRARLILAFIGAAFGAVPFVYGWIRKQYVLGGLALLLCTALSAIGFPHLSFPLAAIAFYGVHYFGKKQDEAKGAKNRSNYKKMMEERRNDPNIRLSGMIENRSVAGKAWPPVDQYVDEDAVAEYQALAEREEAERNAHFAEENKPQ